MLLSEMIQGASLLLRAGWTQGTTARSADGQRCPVDEGVSFCASGALYKVYWDNRGPDGGKAQWENFKLAHEYLEAVADKRTIPDWNDDPTRTVDEVVAAFARIQAMAEQNEKLGIVT